MRRKVKVQKVTLHFKGKSFLGCYLRFVASSIIHHHRYGIAYQVRFTFYGSFLFLLGHRRFWMFTLNICLTSYFKS